MKKILTKILEEINKEKPRLDYIRGLIEASIEEENIPPMSFRDITHPILPDNQNVDEEIIPAAVRVGPVAKLS